MITTLAIGSYTDTEQTALTDGLGAQIMANRKAAIALDADLRGAVRAIAYKSQGDFGGAEMDQFAGLGLIANYGVGYDSIDIAAADARGIKVTNTPGVLDDDVADLAIAMWISQGRQMRQGDAWVRDGHWAETGAMPLNRKVSGGVAGIMGLGRIGREIADRLAAFKMDIHYHARSEKPTPGWTYHADPIALARAVDVLFVALVGGPDTENYVSRAVIEALGPDGVLINISRGSTVDEGALLDALESGALAGAGLDVFANEPRIDPRFAALQNVVLQPHQGTGTVQTRAAMAALQRDNVTAFLAGQALLTPVN